MIPKYNFGNYPNSADYDNNVPIGWNKWDEPEIEDEEDIELENYCETENDIDNAQGS